jgi:hypothetical protein
MANRDRQVDRAREALQEKHEEDRLRAETEESENPERAREEAEPPREESNGNGKQD